jgi:pimeloyl-ACP methyl ester carboxylesterase
MNLIKTDSFELAVYSQGKPEAKKLALFLPGKLDTKDYAHMRSHVDYLANRGFYALSFDPPGTWESPGNISLYTMTNYLKAINELIKYFGNRPTFLAGHSRGATMALIAAGTNSSVTAFAAIMSSFTPNGFINKVDEEWKRKGLVVSMRELPPGTGPKVKKFEQPYSFFEDQIQYRVTDEIKNSTKPKLFIYGQRDVLAPPDRVKQLYEYMSDPKEIYGLNSDHDYRYHHKLIEEVNAFMGDFLSRHSI